MIAKLLTEHNLEFIRMSGTPYVACRRGATAPGRRASLRYVLRDVVGKNKENEERIQTCLNIYI